MENNDDDDGMIIGKEESHRKDISLGNDDSSDIISAKNSKIETENKKEERKKAMETLKVGIREKYSPILFS